MKNIIKLLVILSLLLGCASSFPKNVAVSNPADGKSSESVVIGFKNPNFLGNGYFVLVENSGDNWSVKEISEKKIVGRSNDRQEVLYISKKADYVQPYFEKIRYYNNKGGTFECTPLLDDKLSYTPCTSMLTKTSMAHSVGKNIIAAVTTLGVASGTHKAIDHDKVARVLADTDILAKLGNESSTGKKSVPRLQFVNTRKSVSGDTARINLAITDDGSGIGAIRLFINGSEIYANDRAVGVKKSAGTTIKSYDIKVQSGLNHIKACVYDKHNNLKSEEVHFSIVGDYRLDSKPSLHAVVVGIDTYRNRALDLKCAEADANLFGTTLYKHAKDIFSKVNIHYLRKEQGTTKEAITQALSNLQDISPNDFFIFYSASHGIIEKETFYLICSDAPSTSQTGLATGGISQDELLELFKRIPTSNKLLLFDACHSGGINAQISKKLYEHSAQKLNITSISAAQSQQTAMEGYADGHGIFTYVLSDALEGDADFNGDGIIQSIELVSYANKHVPEAAEEFQHVQYPVSFQAGQVFPVTKHKRANQNYIIAPQYFKKAEVEKLTASLNTGDVSSYNTIVAQNKTQTKSQIVEIKKEAETSDARILENEFKDTKQQLSIDRIKFIFHDDSVYLAITDKVKEHFTFTDDQGHKLLVIDAYSDQFTEHSVNHIDTSKISKIDIGWHNTFYRVTLHLKKLSDYKFAQTENGIYINIRDKASL